MRAISFVTQQCQALGHRDNKIDIYTLTGTTGTAIENQTNLNGGGSC